MGGYMVRFKYNKQVFLYVVSSCVLLSNAVVVNATIRGRLGLSRAVSVISSNLFRKSLSGGGTLRKLFVSSEVKYSPHNKVAAVINEFNNDNKAFLSKLIQANYNIPLSDGMDLVEEGKIMLSGYYYIRDEKEFFPIVSSGDSSRSFDIPKGIITTKGFKGRESKHDDLYDVNVIETREHMKFDLDDVGRHTKKIDILEEKLSGLTSSDRIEKYNPLERNFLGLAYDYTGEILKLKSGDGKFFPEQKDKDRRNMLTVFMAKFSNENDPEFNGWLNGKYKTLKDNGVELKKLRDKLISKSESETTGVEEGIKKLSLKLSSSDIEGASGGSDEIYEKQGAKPKTKLLTKHQPTSSPSDEDLTKIKKTDESPTDEGQKFKINRSDMRKSIKITSGVGEDDSEEGVAIEHGIGYLKVAGMDNYEQKIIYLQKSTLGTLSFDEYFIVQGGEKKKVVPSAQGSQIYNYVLGEDDKKVFEKIEKEIVVHAINRDGVRKKVIPQLLTLDDGTEKTVAYQVDNGLWREVTLSPDGNYYLGNVLKYDGLGSKVVGKLRKAGKIYKRYLAPLTSGAAAVSKGVSGFID